MRLVVGLLALTLSGSLAVADEAKAVEPLPGPAIQSDAGPEAPRQKAGLRVVRILAESNQALLFDKNRGTHVLADVGSVIAGYKVESIEDDEVTLSANGKELVLSAPQPRSGNRSLRQERAEPAPKLEVKAPADPYSDAIVEGPADPYAAPAADAPVDPYAESAVRTVTAPAPIVAGEGGVRVAAVDDDVDAAAPTPSAKRPPNWTEPGFVEGGELPTAAPRSTPAALDTSMDSPADPYAEAPAPVVAPTVLSRSELNVALADFGKLTSFLRGSFTAEGARLDVVAAGSVFAKAGLRAGDIVTAVDNAPLRSLDDAADLYVRASATKAANIQVLRGGKPLALRVLIH